MDQRKSETTIEAKPTTTPYWTCRQCEHPQRCDREQKCCDMLLSDEYYAWCLREQEEGRRGR